MLERVADAGTAAMVIPNADSASPATPQDKIVYILASTSGMRGHRLRPVKIGVGDSWKPRT
jgi:hypothetical protein